MYKISSRREGSCEGIIGGFEHGLLSSWPAPRSSHRRVLGEIGRWILPGRENQILADIVLLALYCLTPYKFLWGTQSFYF